MSNVTFLNGRLSSRPAVRALASGSRLATLQVTVRTEGARAVSVPVAVWDPPATVEALDTGDEVLVLGRVERRFFARGDGGRGSRVEVVADALARAGDRRRAASLTRRASRAFAAALEGSDAPAPPAGPRTTR